MMWDEAGEMDESTTTLKAASKKKSLDFILSYGKQL